MPWNPPMFDVQFARRQMIEQQVRAWEVLDLRVLDAMQQVPREEFVPADYRDLAFADTCVPLGHGQVMLAPKVEGRILQALAIQPDDHALEVGTGSGFFAACIGRLARSVKTIDLFPDFVAAATAAFYRNGVHNVTAATADAMQLAERDAYDVIAVTGSLPVYDARFEQALRLGGRLFVTVGTGPVLEARRITRTGTDDWLRESLFETGMLPLIHAAEPPRFVF
ncbi:MAG TPA: protein-L-isoaspartate O-methyltransferase [Steroidobacteraceae bacterium]